MAKAGLLFVGTDDGALLYSNPNNIGRWLRIGQPFRGQSVRAIWPLPEDPLLVFAAVQGAGLQRSDDGGQSWQPALESEISVIAGARSPAQLLYLSTPAGQVYRSDDNGASWAHCADSGWQLSSDARLIVAADNPQLLYLGLSDGSTRWSSDGGASWAVFASSLPAPIGALAESYASPGLLYALAGGTLYQSAGAAAWQPIATPQSALALTALAGKVPALLLGLSGGGVARSEDGGATWAEAAAEGEWGGDLTSLVSASYHIDTAFAGSAGGKLFSSSDRGRSWQLLKQDLPPIRSIAAARLL